MTELQQKLFTLQDAAYRELTQKTIPNVDPESIIGVRTPELRKLAKSLDSEFRRKLPHTFFEENQLHAFSLESMKDFCVVVEAVDEFLPYVNNWATCDQMTPRSFRTHKAELLPYICRWIQSNHPYAVRFAVKMLMDHFLDGDFDSSFPEMAASVQSDDYYVRMMIAWYFATALAKQYDGVFLYITEYRLEKWIHNKTIQKAIESYRISPEQKKILKQYRMK